MIYNLIILLLLYIGIPLFLSAQLCKKQNLPFSLWVIEVLFALSYVCYGFFVAVWPFTGSYYLRYAVLAIFVVCALRSIANISWQLPFVFKRYQSRPVFAFKILLISFFIVMNFFILKGFKTPEESIDLAFPLRGALFYVAQGGRSLLINHHLPVKAQRYGLDIMELNSFGARAKKLMPKIVEDYLIYKKELYSPCDGVVIRVEDGHLDQPIGILNAKHPAGNYIAIQLDSSDVVVVLAHLLKDSLQVKEGMSVLKGQFLARVGNSGNTTEPHLHIHAVNSTANDLLWEGQGKAITFDKKFLSRNDLVSKKDF